MWKFLKFFLVLLFSLLLLEFLLQLFSGNKTEFDSFDFFLSSLKKRGAPPADLYFVGDSTIFGSGASDSQLYSLPAQLEKLLKRVRPDFKIVNLGYAATCSEDHLKVLSLLPDGAFVAYRGGISDMWNKGGAFRFTLGHFAFELRLVKMFYMLFGSVFFPDSINRAVLIRQKIKRLVELKKLRIFAIDYTIGPSFQSFYTEEPVFTSIPLRSMLEEAGFRAGGNLEDRFVSMSSRSHPNDLGYFLEALFVFNFFCSADLFGLSTGDKLPLSLISDFSGGLFARYEELKSRLHQFEAGALSYEISHLNALVLELYSLASLLKYQDSEHQERYVREHEMLSRLLLLIFHEPSQIASFLMSSHNVYSPEELDKIPDLSKIELYYAVLSATVDLNQHHWYHVHERVKNSRFPLQIRSVSYLPGLSPYPLELCERFVHESGFSAELLSAHREWEYFFAVPFDFFRQQKKSVCNFQM